MLNDFTLLLQTLNIKFKDPGIFRQAFIHRSYLNEVKSEQSSNERLEFLGDSVLSLIISDNLWKLRHPGRLLRIPPPPSL